MTTIQIFIKKKVCAMLNKNFTPVNNDRYFKKIYIF